MKTLHLKSPCCQEIIYQHGGKRRICSKCGKTWTVRPKKRGRKPIRRFKDPVMEILGQGITLTTWASRHHLTLPNASKQFQRNLIKFLKRHAEPIVPLGPYILLVDGLWFTFKKQNWVMFLLALKPLTENRAYFLDPVLLAGGESYDNWTYAISTIPQECRKQIKALVSDGFRTSKNIALEQGWIHQRCHFHLIAYLQVRRGRRKKCIVGGSVREAIYQTIMKLLQEQNQIKVEGLKIRLRKLSGYPDCPRSLKMTVGEFLRALPEFRAYLDYPNLHLPTTTGSVETMCKLIRKRTKTVKTTKALKLWATILVRLKSPITCNGKEH